jgi:hypothetical protein
MGYRSDVTVIMYANTPEEQVMVNEWVKGQLAKRGADDTLYRNNFTFMHGMVRFDAEQWKWYESYPEVQWLEKLFEDYVNTFIANDLSDSEDPRNNSTYAIEYVRVGEEYEDIETWARGEQQGRLYVSRQIMVD